MKTEQEQIKEMMLDVPQTVVAYDANPKGQHLYGEQRLQIAEILYDKGYGRISEYTAEIERLKDDYAKLQEQFAQYQMASDKEIMAQRKHAQIDVLNKANERLNVVSREFGDDCDLCGVSAVCSCRCEINNLIKEVQNGEDKG